MDYKYIILICISSLWIFYDLYQENYHLSEFLFFFKNLIISNLVMTVTLSLPILKIISNKMYNNILPSNKKKSNNISLTSDIFIFYSFVLILFIKRKIFNKIVTNPVFYIIIWLSEILLRRNDNSSWKFNLLILFSLNIYLNEEYIFHNDIHLALKQNIKNLLEFNYSILCFGVIITLSILYTLNKIFIRYFSIYKPAKKLYTSITFSSSIIWYVLTFMDILINNLFQTKTLACIYICIEQWRRFNQIRSIFPTLIFTTLEISYNMRKQMFLRKKQLEINKVDTFFSKMNCPQKIIKEKKENLEIGDFIVVNPDSYSPCTFIVLGVLKKNKIAINKNNNPIEVIINTKSIDGETNDKKKFSCDDITKIKQLIHKSSIDPQLIIKNNYIIRNGSYVCKYNEYPIMGKVINFEKINNNYIDYQKDFIDLFIIKINRFSIFCLLLITILFSVYSKIVNPFFNLNIIVDILLMNNILIPMTLPAFLVIIINKMNFNISDTVYKEKGKRKLIQLTENMFKNDESILKAIHCTDKTGTLTKNSMNFIASYCFKNEKLINPNSFLNKEIVEKHISVTQNTKLAPKLIAEEYEYSKGFQVILQNKKQLSDNWERIDYIWKDELFSITRLFLGFFKKYKSVFSLLRKEDKYQIVVQGPPNTFKGLSGLTIKNIPVIPNLDKILELSKKYWIENNKDIAFPEGCQRNWIIGWSDYFELDTEKMNLLQNICNKKNQEEEQQLFSNFIVKISIIPKKYLLLIDKWRKGVKQINNYLNSKKIGFWILTGDNLENTIKIVKSLNLNQEFIIIDPSIIEEKNFKNFLINKMKSSKLPSTIFLNNEHQQLLQKSGFLNNQDQLIASFLKIFRNGKSYFNLACYSSEKKTKGLIVKFIKKSLQLETIYTGDGQNDILAFEESSLNICMANDNTYDVELSAISDINASNIFWEEYINNEMFNNGYKLWNRIYTAIILSISKQSITAGMSFGLSFITNFQKMEDPYHPFFYQFFQLFSFGTILLYCILSDSRLIKKKHFNFNNIAKQYVFYYLLGIINVKLVNFMLGNNKYTNIYSCIFSYLIILISCFFLRIGFYF